MSDHARPLREKDLDADPLRQFARWFQDATTAGVRMPETAALASASADGAPSVRMVLVKAFDDRGFVLFTNYASRKAGELAANPRAALLFHWDALGRQVRIEGAVARTSAAETEEYVRSRPRGSQLSALASPQSRPVRSRGELERRVQELSLRYGQGELPLPREWGGFRVVPASFEFWQQRADRLHDRLVYRHGDATEGPNADAGASALSRGDDKAGWVIERLAP